MFFSIDKWILHFTTLYWVEWPPHFFIFLKKKNDKYLFYCKTKLHHILHVLKAQMHDDCNFLNFLPNTYGHKSHCMWCCFDIVFYILLIRPHYTWEWLFVWYIGCKPNAYVLFSMYMISCVGRGPWSIH